jgi:quercetin dioxygenase-like cupin family protein
MEGEAMATTSPATGVVFRSAGEGPATWSMGMLFERMLGAGESDGSFGVALVTQAPGSATPLHVHRREAEAFYVLEGSIAYRAGEDVHRLEPGGFIYLPTDVPHAFRITGAAPARFLALAAPSSILSMYEEIGVSARERRLPDAPPTPEDVGRWTQTAERYGVEVVGPPLPEDA